MQRRVLLIAAGGWAGLARAAPPQRNLSVEMRVGEQQSDAQHGAQHGAQAAVVIGSRGGAAEVRGAVVVGAGSSRQTLDTTQRVLVLNGGRAMLRVAQGLPVDDSEVWWTPWGAAGAVRSQWVELVNGFEVRPLWPGGEAPVTLEVSAQRSATAGAGAGVGREALPAQWTMLTTVQAPLGEWVTVAELRGRQSASVSSGGFGAATSSRQRLLQLRVSLP